MNKQEKIIVQIEDLLLQLKKEVGMPVATPRVANQKTTDENFSGLTGEIFSLVAQGYFGESKTLSEIQKKLKEDGVNKPTTALMKPILLLIRKKILGRNKPEKGQYQYYKRSK